jgi:glucose-1-phosphate cytidylyltransferase
MKAVILAGGFGTRISEETSLRPKPMIEIGGMPILWHIMKNYSYYGINDFVICCGYKGYMIKEYFANYFLHMSDVTLDIKNNKMEVHKKNAEPWKITLVDTGINTMTGGRLKKVESHIGNETFCFTYGDGISNVNISELLKIHKNKDTIATVTAVQPPGKFGRMNLKDNTVVHFKEKPIGDEGWINGGFFVLEPSVFKYIKNESTIWEKEPLEELAKNKQLTAYKHNGFWHPVDTLWDKNYLENIWKENNAPWKIWE